MYNISICCEKDYNIKNKSILTIVPLMLNKIRFIFLSMKYDVLQKYAEESPLEKFMENIDRKTEEIIKMFDLAHVKVLIRKQIGNQCFHQYIKIEEKAKAFRFLKEHKGIVIVEYFHRSKQETMKRMVQDIDSDLLKRQKELKAMISELQDQDSQMYTCQIISKTSKSSMESIQQKINVYFISSEPLVDSSRENPLFYQEIDFSQHIERIKRTSLSQNNLLIQAKCFYAIHQDVKNQFSSNKNCLKQINIVQFFTKVQKKDAKIWISFENKIGQQLLYEARQFLQNFHADLLIIIGIGAYYLQEIQTKYPLILITSVSIEKSINIDSQLADNDRISLVFLQTLYQKLFERRQLSSAIDEAKKEVQKVSHYHLWCCCLHEHAQSCSWSHIISSIGHLNAHRLFNHSKQEWKKQKYYPIIQKLQSFALNHNDTCSNSNTCCWDKLKVNKKHFHENPNKVVIWNNKSYNFQPSNSSKNRINQFIYESHDRPNVRKRPMTVFKLISFVLHNKIVVMRFYKLDAAIKIISQAYEYIKLRLRQFFLLKIELTQFISIIWIIQLFVINLKKDIDLPQSIRLLVIFLQGENVTNAYEEFLLDERKKMQFLELRLKVKITINYVLLGCHPSSEYPIFKLQAECDPKQRYFEVFQKIKKKDLYPYNHHQLITIQQQLIVHKNYNQIQIYEKCEEIKQNSPLEYELMGFLSMFGEDGFYLTNFTKIILSALFNKQILQYVLKNKLYLQCIQLASCHYLQLTKSYSIYFNSLENSLKQRFIIKKLEFHYITLRLHEELLPEYLIKNLQDILQSFLKKQGIFSINIELEDESYDDIIRQCKKELILTKRLKEITFNYQNFKSIFHINQVQKLLQLIMNSKKNQQIFNIFYFQDRKQQRKFNYLLWNIILKIHAFLNVQERPFQQKINHFYYVFLLFIMKQSSNSLISQIAKIQICFILGRNQSKITENKNIGQYKIKYFIFCLRLYTIKLKTLLLLKPQWGNAHRYKETLSSCMVFINKFKEFYTQNDANKEILQIFSSHKMFSKSTVEEWNKQSLKLIEKTVVFYFNFRRMIKSQRFNKNMRINYDIEALNHLKLGEIRYEFNKIIEKLVDNQKNKPSRYLLDHYFKVTMNQCKPQRGLLQIIKHRIPLQLQPIYNHLRSKIDKGALFNQKDLVIFARSRTSIVDGKPYIFNRKKYLTLEYLKLIIQGTNLKTNYFNLTTQTFSYLQNDQSNNKCEILYFIMTIDSPNSEYFLIGSQLSIECVKISIKQLTSELIKTKIKFLIINGQNSIKASRKIYEQYKEYYKDQLNGNNSQFLPIILALESQKYNLNDNRFNSYHNQDILDNKYGWEYLCHETNQISMSLIMLSVISFVNRQTLKKKFTLKRTYLSKMVDRSIEIVKEILQSKFQCTEQIFDCIKWTIYGESVFINKIQKGKVEDLTSKFYSHEHNLNQSSYYENVGRCEEIYKILDGLKNKSMSCIQVYGGKYTGKTNILNEAAWTCLLKNLFKFGIIMFDLNEENNNTYEDFFKNRQFINRDQVNQESSLLIIIDNLTSKAIQRYKDSFQKLKGKSITLLYSTSESNLHQKISYLIKNNDILKIDLNKINRNDIYGLLMSHIKHRQMLRQPQEGIQQVRYWKSRIELFDEKVESIMQSIEHIEDGQKFSTALQLLFSNGLIKKQQKNKQFLHFYKQNFDKLVKQLKKENDLTLRFI